MIHTNLILQIPRIEYSYVYPYTVTHFFRNETRILPGTQLRQLLIKTSRLTLHLVLLLLLFL
jgi:hypothetical protein